RVAGDVHRLGRDDRGGRGRGGGRPAAGGRAGRRGRSAAGLAGRVVRLGAAARTAGGQQQGERADQDGDDARRTGEIRLGHPNTVGETSPPALTGKFISQ